MHRSTLVAQSAIMRLSGLLDLLRKDDAYQALPADLRSGSSQSLGLIRAARPYVTAALAQDSGRPTLVVTARIDLAHNLAEQLVAWAPDLRVLTYAEPNPLFYQRTPWGPGTKRARLQTLAELATGASTNLVIVASARGLMQRTLPRETLLEHSIRLEHNGQLPGGQLELLLHRLVQTGYESTTVVTEPGTFSRRGGILDIFPIAAEQPVRIELWGDEVESLRAFDPASQRSLEPVEAVVITPACEALPLYGPEVAQKLSAWFTDQSHRTDEDERIDESNWLADYESLQLGAAFPNIEFYLPWMVDETASLLDYLPQEMLILVDDWSDLADTVADLETQALNLRETGLAAGDIPPEMPLPLVTWAQLGDELARGKAIELAGQTEQPARLGELFVPGPRYGGQLKSLLDDLYVGFRRGNERMVVVSRQAGRLAELWYEHSRGPRPVAVEEVATVPEAGKPLFVQGALAEGWQLQSTDSTTHLLTDAEIFGWQRPEPRRRPTRRAISPETFFADLQPGDFVVHVEYGVGRFQELEKRQIGGVEREFLLIGYAGGDTLYVPIYQADRVSRYVGADDSEPQLSRLGSPEWSRVKEKTRQAVEQIARDLLELYAARETISGYAFAPDSPWQHELEASFPYIETDDQLQALAEVKADMEQPRPMDRLICGDVGYGKTEVALRAAFKAVMSGKQVAVLVPTTVLAQQHYDTFSRRLAPFPVSVEMLSRFRTPSEQAAIVAKLSAGTVDIVIGTHRLLGRDVSFHDLGLLIIDEEQRFGVTHKERFKQMRTEVDVLTLTATPIPRTLYMGLTGARDISMIQTAPEERLPVVTHVSRRDDSLIRQAILREMDRGGQVFFVHNRVQTIYYQAKRLAEIVPEASIGVGHGQMAEAELEAIMSQFAAGKPDVLVSTSIIEAGLDIPNANTLIVDRAELFGLAQLYQLRGRVGRSANRAYAYFFHPSLNTLTSEARARLETIAEHTELGVGMNIAMRDLEIRGAGDILGVRQHGQIAAVGFHLYTRMLSQAISRLRADRDGKVTVHPSPEESAAPPREIVTIDLPIPTYIPTDYVPDISLRIQLYRRMADLVDETAIATLGAELADRFGALPGPVDNLLYQLNVKRLALAANVDAVTSESGQISLRLSGLAHVDRQALQQSLGHNVRVSRTAIWMPRNTNEQDDWKAALLSILTKLQGVHD
ncbi:MAG: transcription-repair coupling factor [Anaerolineae bacterium]|nr:transcription-repair coupling factor [Anaerolineae bacterium]